MQGVADTWTVAGTAAALNGTVSWDPSNTANDMTSTDGVNYTLTVTDCTLEQGTIYAFKVAKNHAWGEAYPSQNKTFTVGETAVYTVVYSFNADTKAVGVEATKTGEAGEITHTYTVAGEPTSFFGGTDTWDAELTANDMEESSGVYTLTKNDVELDGTTIKFKVCVDHAWGTSYPSDNFVITSGSFDEYDGAGTYDVTITFDATSHDVNATVKKKVATNAEITSVVLKHEKDGWGDGLTLTAVSGETNVYSGVLDLSTVNTDFSMKLEVNGDSWVSSENIILATGSVPVDLNGTNYVLANKTSGYQTYTITATWKPNPNAAQQWTLNVEGKDARIMTFYLVGDFTGGWPPTEGDDGSKDVEMTKQANGLYTYEVASFAAEAQKYEYKLRANKVWGMFDLPNDGNNDYTFTEAGNYKLTFTANVTDAEIAGVPAYTLQLNAELIIPGEAIWESDEALELDWSNKILMAAEKFENAKVGDIIHVVLTNVPTDATYDYDAQVFLKAGHNYKNVDDCINVAGTSSKSPVEVADFVITGDILSVAKTYGLMICGKGGVKTALVKLESVDEALGSEKSIWVGDLSENVPISNWHFANAHDFTGVQVGDVVRVTLKDPGWVDLKYNKGYTWTEFAAGDITTFNDWTNPVVLFVINTDAAVAELNDADNNHGVFINVGQDVTVTQVELLSVDSYYAITNDGSTWTVGDKLTEDEGVYTATVSGAGKYFAIAPNTALNATGDAIANWGSVVRPVTTGVDFVVNFANYSDNTEYKADGKVWVIGKTNDADVTIQFTPADGKFAISCQKEVEIGELGYSTYSNSQKYAVSGDGISANFISVSGDVATLNEVAAGAVLPGMAVTNKAGKNGGIILKGTAGAKATISSVALDAEVVTGVADNLMAGSGDNEYQLSTQFADGDEYIAYILYKNDAGKAAFLKWDGSDEPLPAHKAFLALPKTNAAPQYIIFGGGDGATGIEAVTPSQRTGQYYTLDGRRVENPTKGLYIINGKKVVIK